MTGDPYPSSSGSSSSATGSLNTSRRGSESSLLSDKSHKMSAIYGYSRSLVPRRKIDTPSSEVTTKTGENANKSLIFENLKRKWNLHLLTRTKSCCILVNMFTLTWIPQRALALKCLPLLAIYNKLRIVYRCRLHSGSVSVLLGHDSAKTGHTHISLGNLLIFSPRTPGLAGLPAPGMSSFSEFRKSKSTLQTRRNPVKITL